jgi:hypothetical protein
MVLLQFASVLQTAQIVPPELRQAGPQGIHLDFYRGVDLFGQWLVLRNVTVKCVNATDVAAELELLKSHDKSRERSLPSWVFPTVISGAMICQSVLQGLTSIVTQHFVIGFR